MRQYREALQTTERAAPGTLRATVIAGRHLPNVLRDGAFDQQASPPPPPGPPPYASRYGSHLVVEPHGLERRAVVVDARRVEQVLLAARGAACQSPTAPTATGGGVSELASLSLQRLRGPTRTGGAGKAGPDRRGGARPSAALLRRMASWMHGIARLYSPTERQCTACCRPALRRVRRRGCDSCTARPPIKRPVRYENGLIRPIHVS